MKVIIEAQDFKLSRKLTRFINRKVETLDRYHDQIVESIVHLKKIKSGLPENKVCEIRLGIPGNDLFASKEAGTFEQAINKAVYAIKRQIGDRRQKIINARFSIIE